MKPTVAFDGTRLAAAGRRIEVPFRVVTADGELGFDCYEVLRLIPGKRAVVRATCGGAEVVVKLFYGARAARHFMREQRGIAAFEAAGITIPRRIAAQPFEGGWAFAFEVVRGGAPVNVEASTGDESPADAAALAEVLGVVARMHDHGVLQTDLHLDNFLVADGAVVALDGGGVVPRRRPISRSEGVRNVAELLAQLPPGSDALATTAIRHYAHARGWTIGPKLLARSRARIQQARRRRIAQHLRKALRDCTEFEVVRSASRFAVLDRARAHTEVRTLVDDPERALRLGEVLKAGNTATVSRLGDLVVKRYHVKGLLHLLGTNLLRWTHLRASRAQRAWLNGRRLVLEGIDTARPLALIATRAGWLRRETYLVTEFIDGVRLDEAGDRPGVAQALAGCLERLDAAEVTQRDAKASNFIVDGETVYAIDLDSLLPTTARRRARARARMLDNWRGETRARFEAALRALESSG